MVAVKRERLSGWGLTPATFCASYRPEKERELSQLLAEHKAPLIARGLGRSYGDASLQPEGTIKTERLDHFIEWDPHNAILRAQSGASLADVMAFSVPRGFLPPVIPGTKYVTLGGAFACNVHGKNQYKVGEFAEHTVGIRLLLASGKAIECSPFENAELFWATAGGMGMTGIIEEVSLRLKPIASASLTTQTKRVAHSDEMIDCFAAARHTADHMIGWIDHMAEGDEIGRGIFESATHTLGGEGKPLTHYQTQQQRWHVPLHAPSLLLNRYTMALYNRRRFGRYDAHIKNETVDLGHFFHPLDTISDWNKLYGKGGFFQYQCLLPESDQVKIFVRQLLQSLQAEKIFSFLAVIKYHRDSKAMLGFSKAGYSIALDFPNTARVRSAMPQINRWIADHGGCVYLAKDALLTADMFDAMYSKNAARWREQVNEVDPYGRFASMMSQRLLWK